MAPADMSAFISQLAAGGNAALPGLALSDIRAIGEGSYANVFRAHVSALGMPNAVALKVRVLMSAPQLRNVFLAITQR